MKNILLVGSDCTPGSYLCELLNRAGFRVTTETDKHSMLFLLASGMPLDLVIIDDHIQDRNVNNFVRSARHISPLTPIIVMTSRGSIMEYLQSLSLGVFEYLHKPVRDRDLMRVVHVATGSPRHDDRSHTAA